MTENTETWPSTSLLNIEKKQTADLNVLAEKRGMFAAVCFKKFHVSCFKTLCDANNVAEMVAKPSKFELGCTLDSFSNSIPIFQPKCITP